MDDDEAALLAELRAISQTSSAASRFRDESDEERHTSTLNTNSHKDLEIRSPPKPPAAPSIKESPNSNTKQPSPWKERLKSKFGSWTKGGRARRKSNGSASDGDSDAIESIGNEGGEDHFSSNREDNMDDRDHAIVPTSKDDSENIPTQQQVMCDDHLSQDVNTENNVVSQPFNKQGMKIASSFQGERGGPAEDEELRQMLLAVSAKSAASRFDDDTESTPHLVHEQHAPPAAQTSVVPRSTHDANTGKFQNLRNTGGGIKPEIPSTFKGERGGAAEDAELLALLRGVSAKSASSRFDDEEPNEKVNAGSYNESEHEQSEVVTERTQMASGNSRSAATGVSHRDRTPPWRKGGVRSQRESTNDVDVMVVAAPIAPPTVADKVAVNEKDSVGVKPGSDCVVHGIKSEIPSTFKGERGGTAEDAELLALLRGVSAKSASSRFDDDEPNEKVNAGSYNESEHEQSEVVTERTQMTSGNSRSAATGVSHRDRTPPWRKGGVRSQRESTNDVDVMVVAAPVAPRTVADKVAVNEKDSVGVKPGSDCVGHGIKSELPSTFKGERGGAAEDAELLALLRGVSAKSASSRFDDDEPNEKVNAGSYNESEHEQSEVVTERTQMASGNSRSAATGVSHRDRTPPWRKGGVRSQRESTNDVDVMVVAAPVAPRTVADKVAVNEKDSVGVKPGSDCVGHGIKSEIPSTFKGERGGTAEDAELLALLRGVSAKSASSRFDDEDCVVEAKAGPYNESEHEQSELVTERTTSRYSEISRSEATGTSRHSSTPPWRKGGVRSERNGASDVDINASLPLASTASVSVKESNRIDSKPLSTSVARGIKSEVPSTFKGERGGAAEDAELLALLRGVSAKSAASRFDDEAIDMRSEKAPADTQDIAKDDRTTDTDNIQKATRQSSDSVTTSYQNPVSVDTKPFPAAPSMSSTSIVAAANDTGDDIIVSRDNLPITLSSKDWKVRVKSFELLQSIILDLVKGGKQPGSISSSLILEGLDSLVPTFVQDSNAGALDKALEFAITYAENCDGASNADKAADIAHALVDKSALSSRPSTTKLAISLAFKLMEVGCDGKLSLHRVVEVLLQKGLTSRKPKVVQNTAVLLQEAVVEFGAWNFPVAGLTCALPSLLAHTNATVRENGLHILAELARVFTRNAVQDVIASMKKSQVSQFDALLESQSSPSPVKTRLRSQVSLSATSDLLVDDRASLASRAKELEAERYASRPQIDLVSAVAKTDYSSRIELQKWSEKVAALDTVLQCAGEKPYKLAQPSSTVNYAPLISEMKKLLSHTHFAVCSKAMEVIGMLAQGVGEKLYPHLRPLLTPLMQLSKDKKLTKSVSSCLDSLFGNVLSFDALLDEECLPILLDEKIQKNALARATAADYLERCVCRRETAGPRGHLGRSQAQRVVIITTGKLADSDALVRKVAISVFLQLQKITDTDISETVADGVHALKESHPRVYKQLINNPGDVGKPEASVKHDTAALQNSPAKQEPSLKSTRHAVEKRAETKQTESINSGRTVASCGTSYNYDDAVLIVGSLGIPAWDAPEDDGGVLAGLQSTKWAVRQDAIKSIDSFISSGKIDHTASDVAKTTSAIICVIKEYSRGFKETNVNILKAIFQLFLEIVKYHESKSIVIPSWTMKDSATLAILKISDRKLSAICKVVLTEMCTVCSPHSVLEAVIESVADVRSPIAHEEVLTWFKSFCEDFGVNSLGSSITSIIPWVLNELETSNPKVKKEALAVMSTMYAQIGPKIRALSISIAKTAETKTTLETCFNSSTFDASSVPTDWNRRYMFDADQVDGARQAGGAIDLEVPRTDIFSLLTPDIIAKLNSKDGKAAWKHRKEALDALGQVVSGCTYLIDSSTANRKKLADLLRALRDRLSDTQINLRPLAAQTIGKLLSLLDKPTQAKLGKLVYASLISGAMNDIKKPVRDACVEAISIGTSIPSLDGGGINEEALEGFVAALVAEVNESSIRAHGLPEVLQLLLNKVNKLPNLDNIASGTGNALGVEFAAVVVECLTSSKAETRNMATSLLESVIFANVVSHESFRKALAHLKPAKQRTVAPILSKFSAAMTNPSRLTVRDAITADRITSAEVVDSNRSRDASTPSSRKDSRMLTGKFPQLSKTESKNAITQDSRAASSGHPLAPRQDTSKTIARGIVWPEYPEEPQGSTIFGNLKKEWSQIISASSIAVLFPLTGIRKQDEAEGGCVLLRDAVTADRYQGTIHVRTQIELVVKWIAYALCSRETTVGLQSILSLAKDIFSYLLDSRDGLSDAVAMEIIPYLVDKASNAKGRFRDIFLDLLSLARSEELMPSQRFGSVVCVAVIERSPHAKGRVMACQICQECIDLSGINACGKRGVLATAKALSEEKVPENRLAALDLMELIFSKMNGEKPRLARICGSSLSDQGMQLIMERWQKRALKSNALTSESCGGETISVSPPLNEIAVGLSQAEERTPSQLPALSLRAPGNHDSASSFIEPEENTQSSNYGPLVETAKLIQCNAVDEKGRAAIDDDIGGAAANLRARLLRIKERVALADEPVSLANGILNIPTSNTDHYTTKHFDDDMQIIRSLMAKNVPVSDDDPHVVSCIDTLKKFHAALSKQHGQISAYTSEDLLALRECMISQTNTTVETLTRLIHYAFNCGENHVNSKMSIPLLSVCLATLMALFRDTALCPNVSQDDLTLLIRETGSALLDPRLSSSSDLDEATASQMVRAINKLAVQAATGAPRHSSLLALMTLQQQLSHALSATRGEEEAFNTRLSRVVTKLFMRVIKAEESTNSPFSELQIDLEALVCFMEDLLVAFEVTKDYCVPAALSESVEACRTMVNSLVEAIVRAHGGDEHILKYFDALGIDRRCSPLGNLIDAIGGRMPTVESEIAINSTATIKSTPTHASRDVAALVSALASASNEFERDVALESLRSYRSLHGDDELDAHLREVSSPFRAFIKDQLRDDSKPEKAIHDSAGDSMSERLASLRSRLQATEHAVQSAVDDKPSAPDGKPSVAEPSRGQPPHELENVVLTVDSPARSHLSPSRRSKLTRPSPSKFGTTSRIPSASTPSLQDRMALSQQNRRVASTASALPTVSGIGTTMGRAAALRARLEAVKQKNHDNL